MSIFERISDLVRANINDLIDKAEDPEKMVKQIIIDMEEQIRKSTQSLGIAMGSLNSVKKQLAEAQARSNNWQAKAKTCLEQGNEELAKQALENKVKEDKMVAQYQEMTTATEKQVNEMQNQINILKQKLEEARSKQAMITARSQMADAKTQMAKTLGNMDSKSAFAKMDKMEQKVAQKEAQADAFSEVSGIQESESDPFAKMDQDNAINAELEKLKAQMNSESNN
ncbi:MAG: PspA/IM30 family protein [Clostridia bacterium]|nr:PspA/IM30 family protein [Clostridia bacterium]